jgi:hypothetical protein
MAKPMVKHSHKIVQRQTYMKTQKKSSVVAKNKSSKQQTANGEDKDR